MGYNIFWSDEALDNLEEIIEYLRRRWTEKEVDKFKSKLADQLELISTHPAIFPQSDHNPRLRKAVLSKQTIIFYEVKDFQIKLVYLFQTKKNPNELEQGMGG